MKDTLLRSLAKSITWRIILTTSHTVNGFIVSGSWTTGLQIAGLALVTGSIIYWLHERLWNFAQWNKTPSETSKFIEGQLRTLGKVASWRVTITLQNFLVAFVLTGSWLSSLGFLGLASIVNSITYYIHERVWNKINWGRI